MTMEPLPHVSRKYENNMLRNRIVGSLRQSYPNLASQFPSSCDDHSCAGGTADTILPGDSQVDLGHHGPDILHSGLGNITFSPFFGDHLNDDFCNLFVKTDAHVRDAS